MCHIFDFIFNKEFLKSILGPLIATGTALLIFYLSIKKDKRKERKEKKREAHNRIRNFLNLLNSSKSHAENTISNLNQMINSYETSLINFQLLRFSPNKSFERLDGNLKNENYFQSFIKKFGKNKVDNFNRLSLIIDYFNLQLDHLWAMVEKAQLHDYERKIKFNDLSKKAVNQIARLTIHTSYGISDDELEILGSILVEYHVNMVNSIEHQYIYLRKFLTEGLSNHISNPNITDLIELIKDASELFNEIQSQNKNHKQDLIQIRYEMQFSLQTYSIEINNLN
ncbi:hypothetical protein J3D55_003035 [Chryseobacterium ginsenosidimutans]|uniref:hypothetical protein n=1 Tax=Chryseobacterium ginsenosidimutans TaxID=687846 RepID=UPI002167239D|nr:hypothetical protein [Chryseobacterium ginsenosidimutans]MCS3870119.1 hypothetical protein [Chryseobacterium ginsenosidimutans]